MIRALALLLLLSACKQGPLLPKTCPDGWTPANGKCEARK